MKSCLFLMRNGKPCGKQGGSQASSQVSLNISPEFNCMIAEDIQEEIEADNESGSDVADEAEVERDDAADDGEYADDFEEYDSSEVRLLHYTAHLSCVNISIQDTMYQYKIAPACLPALHSLYAYLQMGHIM